jgi:hypothetical protein
MPKVTPPPAARAAAKRALEVRAEVAPSKRGGLTTQEAGAQGIGSGVARAAAIAAGRPVDAGRVVAFFDRFAGQIADAQGTPLEDSKMLQAAGLWGGPSMKAAAEKAIRKAEKGGK